MYAVIASGGKQYRVALGQVLTLEKLSLEEGQDITFEEVLMIADGDNFQIGQPLLKGTTVKGVVRQQKRGKKIQIIKFRRRKHSMKQMGHRQDLTEVEITQIGDKKQVLSKNLLAEKDDVKEVHVMIKVQVEKKPAAETQEEKKPVAKKAAAKSDEKKATPKKPVTEKKADGMKPSAKKPAAKKPVAKKPAAKKPTAKSKDEGDK